MDQRVKAAIVLGTISYIIYVIYNMYILYIYYPEYAPEDSQNISRFFRAKITQKLRIQRARQMANSKETEKKPLTSA